MIMKILISRLGYYLLNFIFIYFFPLEIKITMKLLKKLEEENTLMCLKVLLKLDQNVLLKY